GPDGSQCRPGSGGPGGRGLAAKTCGWRHWRHTPEPAVLTDWLQRSAISRAFSERLRTLEPDEHGKALRPILEHARARVWDGYPCGGDDAEAAAIRREILSEMGGGEPGGGGGD